MISVPLPVRLRFRLFQYIALDTVTTNTHIDHDSKPQGILSSYLAQKQRVRFYHSASKYDEHVPAKSPAKPSSFKMALTMSRLPPMPARNTVSHRGYHTTVCNFSSTTLDIYDRGRIKECGQRAVRHKQQASAVEEPEHGYVELLCDI